MTKRRQLSALHQFGKHFVFRVRFTFTVEAERTVNT
jgi:hypothetical protein